MGGYPGVELMVDDAPVAEVDVLLLLTSGALVPVEVKSTFAGMQDQDLVKLEQVATRLDSPFDIVVVQQAVEKAQPGGWTA